MYRERSVASGAACDAPWRHHLLEYGRAAVRIGRTPLTKGPFGVASLLLFTRSCAPSAVPAPTAPPMSTQIEHTDAPALQILFIGNTHM